MAPFIPGDGFVGFCFLNSLRWGWQGGWAACLGQIRGAPATPYGRFGHGHKAHPRCWRAVGRGGHTGRMHARVRGRRICLPRRAGAPRWGCGRLFQPPGDGKRNGEAPFFCCKGGIRTRYPRLMRTSLYLLSHLGISRWIPGRHTEGQRPQGKKSPAAACGTGRAGLAAVERKGPQALDLQALVRTADESITAKRVPGL